MRELWQDDSARGADAGRPRHPLTYQAQVASFDDVSFHKTRYAVLPFMAKGKVYPAMAPTKKSREQLRWKRVTPLTVCYRRHCSLPHRHSKFSVSLTEQNHTGVWHPSHWNTASAASQLSITTLASSGLALKVWVARFAQAANWGAMVSNAATALVFFS